MTKDQLLQNIKRDRARLDDLVGRLSDDELLEGGAGVGWSVKDHLSHIAAWERMIVAHLRDGCDHEVVRMDQASYAGSTLDELNDQIYRLHRDWPAEQVRDEFGAAYGAIVAFLSEMPEGRLTAPYWDDDPSGRTVLDKIAGDTYLHYCEHAGWIDELIAQSAGAT